MLWSHQQTVWELSVSPPSEKSSMRQLNVPIVPKLKEKHVKSPILSLFCLLGALFTYVLIEKQSQLAPVPLEREATLLIRICFHLLLEIKNKFNHSFSQSVSHSSVHLIIHLQLFIEHLFHDSTMQGVGDATCARHAKKL